MKLSSVIFIIDCKEGTAEVTWSWRESLNAFIVEVCRLGLYEISDFYSPRADKKLTAKIIRKGEAAKSKRKVKL